jgi:hypothetical protein
MLCTSLQSWILALNESDESLKPLCMRSSLRSHMSDNIQAEHLSNTYQSGIPYPWTVLHQSTFDNTRPQYGPQHRRSGATSLYPGLLQIRLRILYRVSLLFSYFPIYFLSCLSYLCTVLVSRRKMGLFQEIQTGLSGPSHLTISILPYK